MKFAVPKALVRAAIVALEYKAMMEAGQSQKPDLFIKEETVEWRDAQLLKLILRRKEAP
jgi:hypothetical protein